MQSPDCGHAVRSPQRLDAAAALTADTAPARSEYRHHAAVLGLGFAFFVVILVRTAWVSDTAFLTLRTVENAATGFGLRWNVVERVQVFDHPLWLFVLLVGRLLTGDTYFTTLAIGMLSSLLCGWVVLREARNEAIAVLAFATLGLSPLFVAFSTSGLESPLLHLLSAGLIAGVWRANGSPRSLGYLAGLTALAVLTHWTAILLALPVLLPMLGGTTRRFRLKLAAFGFGPLFLWLLYSWWYYGSIGPNRWLADRTAQLPWMPRLEAGREFLLESARLDPLLAGVMIAGLAMGGLAGGRDASIALGGFFVLAWTIVAGGSPMAGYGLTLPLLVGLLLMMRRLTALGSTAAGVAAVAVILLGSLASRPTATADSRYGTDYRRTARTHDARAEFYQATALLLTNRYRLGPRDEEMSCVEGLVNATSNVTITSTPGICGVLAGPAAYVVDPTGITDPLLARLPPKVGARWQWGIERRVPDGYPDNLHEPSLAALSEQLRVASREPLTQPGRLAALSRLPRETARLVEGSSYGPEELLIDEVRVSAGDEPRPVREGGIIVTLGARQPVLRMAAKLSQGYDYEIHVLDGTSTVATVASPRLSWDIAPASMRYLVLDRRRAATALWFRCGRGVGPCTLDDVSVGN
jgi:arabinofuranosyltransferase